MDMGKDDFNPYRMICTGLNQKGMKIIFLSRKTLRYSGIDLGGDELGPTFIFGRPFGGVGVLNGEPDDIIKSAGKVSAKVYELPRLIMAFDVWTIHSYDHRFQVRFKYDGFNMSIVEKVPCKELPKIRFERFWKFFKMPEIGLLTPFILSGTFIVVVANFEFHDNTLLLLIGFPG
jgi:hypothetical protein